MSVKPSNIIDLLNDTRSRSLVFQVLLLLAVIFGLWWVVDNTVTNLASQNKSVGFGFINQTAGFQIGTTLGTWLFDYQVATSTYLDVFLIGIVNTFIVAVFGIIAATALGFSFGIMRLSSNLIIRGFATVYIEFIRNIPLLLQLFFLYFAVLRSLPDKRSKIELIPDVAGINIAGFYLPLAQPEEGFVLTVIALLVAFIFVLLVIRWARARQRQTGQTFPVFRVSAGLLIILPLAVFMASGRPLSWELPVFLETGSVVRQGYQAGYGMIIIPEMIALWLALSLYTAGFIAEIVRAGILAVNKGQTEAAKALGLRQGAILRLVIIPQAMRIIIPPLTSQYLNLTKNSSLAVAIAYPELVSIFAGTALNQVGKEIEMIFMMMSVYLFFSITTALFMNWFNARYQLVER